MQRTPVNFDSALETLRGECPDSAATSRLIAQLRSPKPARTRLVPRVAVSAALLIVVAIFWPRPVGASWQQALDQTKSAQRMHRVNRQNGQIVQEAWREGVKEANYIRDPKGNLIEEMRQDGHRMFMYFNEESWERLHLPNRISFATVSTTRDQWLPYRNSEDLASAMLARGDIQLIDQQKVTTPDGERIQYHVLDRRGKDSYSVYAEPDTGKIRRIVAHEWEADLEYPTSIDPRVFEPRAQIVKDVVTVDRDLEKRQVEKTLVHLNLRQDGITLRAALLDGQGILWVFWTGYTPDGKLSRPFAIPAVQCGPAFGPSAFTTSYAKDKYSRPAPSIGLRLNGMGRWPLAKIGDYVDIDVPTPRGKTQFSHVPVLRIGRLDDVSVELGMRAKGKLD